MIKKLYLFLFVYDLNDLSSNAAARESESWKVKLRKDITCLVLLSYTLLIFNPVIPIFTDLIAHTFWEKEHIATEHRIYGKNHVQFEIAKSEKQPDQNKNSANSKSGTEDFTHILNFSLVINFPGCRTITRSYLAHQFFYRTTYPDQNYPPPRV